MVFRRITVKDRVRIQNLRNGSRSWVIVREDTNPLVGMQVGDMTEIGGEAYRVLNVRGASPIWFL